MIIIYLVVNHCGLTLKEAGERYNAVSYFSVSKASRRFAAMLEKDIKLKRQIKRIMSNSQM